nr:MAG TPA: hypothetical protein [Inoviridae sp.]
MEKDDWTFTSPFVFLNFSKNKAIRMWSLTAYAVVCLNNLNFADND